MALTAERKGQIALAILKNKLRDDGLSVSQCSKRELANKAKELGIPIEELMEFAEVMARELVDEFFKKN